MNTHSAKQKKYSGGYLMILVLVFGAIFFTIISSFTVFIVTQSRLIAQRVELETAGQIAEAGLNYYKWYLAHYPNDVTNGTGLPGPYVGVYNDPEGGPIGEYSLSIASTTYCGDVASIRVTSVGSTYAMPNIKRTMTARYTKPTVADYAFILNSNVWAGADRIVNGPYHSNGGIRFDGTNNGSVTSGQTTWTCDSGFGCSPTGNRNGVFTTTGNPNTALFDFPASNIDFNGITVDLSQMKTRAQNNGGLYIPPAGGTNAGYRITFNSNNTVTVRRVTSTISHRGNATGAPGDWVDERNIINNSTLVNTYVIPASCPLIYVEDKVWLEGTVASRVAIAAASDTATDPSMILQGNITYTSATGSALLAIAEQDVLIGVNVPEDMYINGIFIAKNGKYGRNLYCGTGVTGSCSGNNLPTAFLSSAALNSENFNGTIVSNGRVGTQWTNGSGFANRFNTYDRNLVTNPPPLIPSTSDDYEFSDWQDAN
ncbi:hypothetical protein K2P47_03425 [Patescibacteria group bacterium]|nr:hypothetical protein [Patescibacteria group bacterium]